MLPGREELASHVVMLRRRQSVDDRVRTRIEKTPPVIGRFDAHVVFDAPSGICRNVRDGDQLGVRHLTEDADVLTPHRSEPRDRDANFGRHAAES
jgi:hypothetical protein